MNCLTRNINSFRVRADVVKVLIACLLILAGLVPAVSGQSRPAHVPISFSKALSPDNVPVADLSPPSEQTIREEMDAKPMPYRFGLIVPSDLTPSNSGITEVTDDSQVVWRLSVHCAGAKGLILYFDRFSLPAGGKLFLYNPTRTRLFEADPTQTSTTFNNYAFPLMEGETAVLEYNAPAVAGFPDIRLSEVAYIYRDITVSSGEMQSLSGSCEVNVNCPEGDNWQRQKRGIVKIIVKDSLGRTNLCSGSMINNTSNNGIPYLLTASHCGRYSRPSDINQWLFYFNYEMPGCSNTTARTPATLLGAVRKATGGTEFTGSDFFLVRLNQTPADSLHVYFNGWSREETPSPQGTGIHHPAGDVKKISTYISQLTVAQWPGNPYPCFWMVYWAATANGHGVTEGGSSGSPIFNPSGQIVGTLTGGDSGCASGSQDLPDYYGMFSWHWDKNGSDSTQGLKYWLDPNNTGVMSTSGWAVGISQEISLSRLRIYPNPAASEAFLSGEPESVKEELTYVTLSDLFGRSYPGSVHMADGNKGCRFDLSGMTSGIYLVTVGTRLGNRSLKLVKM